MFTITLKPLALRLLFLLLLFSLLAGLSWHLIRTAIGDSLVTYARRSVELDSATRIQAAAAAVRYAPDDPTTRYQSGLVYLEATADDIDGKNLDMAIQELRTAARLNPEDFRVWLMLGQALTQAFEAKAGAEARQALEQAIQLAPQHFEPRWRLGNLLLRTGERAAACKAFQIPMTNHPGSFPLIFNAVWEAYQGDLTTLLRDLNTPRRARAELAIALVWRKYLPEALEAWKEAEQTTENAKQLIEILLLNHYYKAAYDIWQKLPGKARKTPDEGSLMANGGFDQEIIMQPTEPFLTWQITPHDGITLSLDRQQPFSRPHSLFLHLETTDSSEFIFARQTLPISPATGYRLKFAVKSTELKSFSPPLVEVIDAAGANIYLVATPAIETNLPDWHECTLDFITRAGAEAITVRIIRRACKEAPCPLTGRVWFDNFSLTPITK